MRQRDDLQAWPGHAPIPRRRQRRRRRPAGTAAERDLRAPRPGRPPSASCWSASPTTRAGPSSSTARCRSMPVERVGEATDRRRACPSGGRTPVAPRPRPGAAPRAAPGSGAERSSGPETSGQHQDVTAPGGVSPTGRRFAPGGWWRAGVPLARVAEPCSAPRPLSRRLPRRRSPRPAPAPGAASPPSAPPAAAPPASPPPAAQGPGKGNAKGHEKSHGRPPAAPVGPASAGSRPTPSPESPPPTAGRTAAKATARPTGHDE